jgi:sulfate permease, SulP family
MNKKPLVSTFAQYLPILQWGPTYTKDALTNDLLAAVIVTIMLVPQSLAYALLAGLPAEMGIYASIVPILLYAIFGTSRVLAVGVGVGCYARLIIFTSSAILTSI